MKENLRHPVRRGDENEEDNTMYSAPGGGYGGR